MTLTLVFEVPQKHCTAQRPFYSYLLGDLAIEWQRGWR